MHEDPKNPNLIYAGTEHGLYLSADGGQHWIAMASNLPRVQVNDFVIHPRDNDLVLATHGRGVWILDDLTALQALTPQVMSEAAHLFAVRPAEEIRYFNPKAHTGDMIFRGENPPAGALIDYYFASDPGATGSSVTILDAAGKPIAAVKPTHDIGINRIVWNLRYDALRRVARELQSRIVSLYRAIGDATGKPTADQQSQAQFYKTELESLRTRAGR